MIGGELDSGDIIAKLFTYKFGHKITNKWMSLKVPELFVDSVNKIEQIRYFEKQSKNESDASSVIHFYQMMEESIGIVQPLRSSANKCF